MGLLTTAAAQHGSFREMECTTGVPLCTELMKGKSTLRGGNLVSIKKRVKLSHKPTV